MISYKSLLKDAIRYLISHLHKSLNAYEEDVYRSEETFHTKNKCSYEPRPLKSFISIARI
jgi:hypothetical protein